MDDKRGQVTLFVIMAVAIVLIFMFVFFTQKDKIFKTSTLTVNQQSEKVSGYSESYVEETEKMILLIVGLQGGYYNVPEPSFNELILQTPYYYSEGKVTVPKKERIEKEISEGIKDILSNETWLDEFKKNGFNISFFVNDTKATIDENETNLSISYAIKVTKNDESVFIEKSEKSNYQIKLGQILLIAEKLINKTKEEPNAMDIQFVANLFEQNNLGIMPQIYDNGVLVYTIQDNEPILHNQPYKFNFAIKP